MSPEIPTTVSLADKELALIDKYWIHVRGFKERGTTTTPFDMVMINDLDRFHLVMDVVDRVDGLASRAAVLRQRMMDARMAARAYTREHGEDDPQIANWIWERDDQSDLGVERAD